MYEVTEKQWFKNVNGDSFDQVSGFEREDVMSHTEQSMAEIIAMSPESESVSVSRYANGSTTNFTTSVILQSQNNMYDKHLLSVIGQLRLGDIVEADGRKYLITSPSRENLFYEAHFARMMTSTIKLFSVTKVDTGKRTSTGQPIYEEVKTEINIPIAFHSFAETSGEETSTYAPLNSPKNQLRFMVQLNQHKAALKELNSIFFMGLEYIIDYADYTNTDNGNFGIVTIEAKRKI